MLLRAEQTLFSFREVTSPERKESKKNAKEQAICKTLEVSDFSIVILK